MQTSCWNRKKMSTNKITSKNVCHGGKFARFCRTFVSHIICRMRRRGAEHANGTLRHLARSKDSLEIGNGNLKYILKVQSSPHLRTCDGVQFGFWIWSSVRTSVSLRLARTRGHSLKSSISTASSAPYHLTYDISSLNIVRDEYSTTKSGGDNETSQPFLLLQLYVNNQTTIWSNMIQMSSRRRAIV